MRSRLSLASFACLWLFAAVACLSIAAQNVLFVGMVAWVVLLVMDRKLPRIPKFFWVWLAFVVLALLASCLSDNASHSIFTWRKWLLGFTTIYVADAVEDSRQLRAILGSLIFFGALTFLGAALWCLGGPLHSGLTFHEILAQWPDRGEWRAVSGSGGYMVLGTCSNLLFVFFGTLWIKDRTWRSPLVLACLVCTALALVMTQTRSAWLGAAVCSFILLWSWRKIAALSLVALSLAFVLVFPGNPVSRRLHQGVDMSQDSTRERVYMDQAGMAIIRDHPWLGVGDAMESFDGHPGYFLRYLPAGAKKWDSLRNQDQGHLHNDLVQVAGMYGLPATFLLLVFFGWIGFETMKNRTPLGTAMGLALLAWFVNGMFEYDFGSFQSSFVLWFLIGLYFAGAKLHERSAD